MRQGRWFKEIMFEKALWRVGKRYKGSSSSGVQNSLRMEIT